MLNIKLPDCINQILVKKIFYKPITDVNNMRSASGRVLGFARMHPRALGPRVDPGKPRTRLSADHSLLTANAGLYIVILNRLVGSRARLNFEIQCIVNFRLIMIII